jgi:hypothetical protein
MLIQEGGSSPTQDQLWSLICLYSAPLRRTVLSKPLLAIKTGSSEVREGMRSEWNRWGGVGGGRGAEGQRGEVGGGALASETDEKPWMIN